MTEQTEAPEPTPDSAPELRPDGTIRFDIDAITYRLRMPRLGELRELKEARVAVIESCRAEAAKFEEQERLLRDQVADAKAALNSADDGDELQTAGAELRRLLGSIRDTSEQISADLHAHSQTQVIGWVRLAVAKLSRPKGSDLALAEPLPDEDDLPVWAGAMETTTAWLEHWMTYPKRPGA